MGMKELTNTLRGIKSDATSLKESFTRYKNEVEADRRTIQDCVNRIKTVNDELENISR